MIFVENVAATKLSTVASSPREYHSLIVDRSSMVVSKCQLCDCVLLEVFHLARNWLPPDVDIAKSAELAVSPSVYDSIFGHCSRIVVSSRNELRHLPIFVFFERVRVQLVWTFDVL